MRIINQKTLQKIFASLCLSLMLGCSTHEAPPKPVKQQPFTICLGGILAPLPFVAKERGFFQAEGIAAEFFLLGDGKEAMNAFLQGKCDACLSGEFPVVSQSFERGDFVIIATLTSSDNAVKVLARRDRVTAVANLPGKKIGVSMGTISNFFFDQFLKKNNLPRGEMHLVNLSHRDAPAALQRGDIDAFAGSDIAYLKGNQLLGGQGVTFSEPGLTNHFACLTVRKAWLKANKATAGKVLKALVAAEDELVQHPEELTTMLAHELKMPLADVLKIQSDQHNRVMLDQILLLALEDEARWMIENGTVKGTGIPNYLRFLEPALLKEVKPAAVSLQ